ncbi:MAG TPA: hypothetical protein VG756_11705 [Pseudonocardiaceae bacterium]|jgi:hypothetical protein|nr:hypothetical protein [Pseudonocardiaceae bacterium]
MNKLLVFRALAVAGVTLVAGLGVTGAAQASTVSPDVPYRCGNNYCANVTAIDAGSALVFHKYPNYSVTVSDTPYLHDGDAVHLSCYLTSDTQDADGNGDYVWWSVSIGTGDSFVRGFVNDWYLTTGGPGDYESLRPSCGA